MENSKFLDSLSLIAEKDDSSDSIRIFSMDKVKKKAYGASSDDGLFETKEINNKLKTERLKALKTLELFEASQRNQKQNVTKGKTDSIKTTKPSDSFKFPKTPGFDRTDYLSYNSYKTLNITDLQTEHTINLESTGKLNTPVSNKISFEPSEITGRSTLYRGEKRKKTAEELTVEEILASSYSGNVRNLRESLHGYNSMGTTESQNRSSLSSLPKTADMSKMSGTESLMRTQNTKGFSFTNAHRADESDFMGESFTPAELMSSKFAADELAWAQEHRTIPTHNTSYTSDQNKSSDKKNKSDFSMNSAFDGNNVSQLTDFFRKRSENLYDIVTSSASPAYREPVALIDDSINSTISNYPESKRDTTNSTISSEFKNPEIDHKTYSQKSEYNNRANPINLNGFNLNKKLDEPEDESYILSLSSIANALKNINSVESGTSIMNKLFSAQRAKSGLNEKLINKNSIDSKKSYSLDSKTKLHTQPKDYNQNKENVDPISDNNKDNDKQFCDTATFTDSLLDTSDFKKIIQNQTFNDYVSELTQKQSTNFVGRSSKSSSRMEKSNITNDKWISSPKFLLQEEITPRRAKSPSNSNELYAAAAAGAPLEFLAVPVLTNEMNRKRSRSASNLSREQIIINEENLTNSHISINNLHDVDNNLQLKSPNVTPEKSKFLNSSKKLIPYLDTSNSSHHNELSAHFQPIVSNPTLTIDSIRQIRREKNLKKTHSSTRLNNEASEIRSVSPNFYGTRSDFRSPSPIPTSEKSKYVNSPISSVYNSPKSMMSSPKYHNSPNSPNSLETTTNSERRYLMGGGNHQIPSSVSPDCLGKMSLPNYGLVTRQPSHLLVKSKSRCNSQCSSSSEFSHYDDKKLPIKVTCTQFNWGSVKLRTNSKKSMQIKNFSRKRLVLKVQISGPGFQIINLENSGNLLTLQSQECRSIEISFCPTVLGAAVGLLTFLSPQENTTNACKISLYGYGGHAIVVPQGIQKGPIGLPFITMGELQELSRPLVRTFTIYNKGPLNAFVVICLSSMGLDIPRLCDCIDIEPRKASVRPDDIVKFRITFKPRRDDLKRIIKKISGVMTLATLRILTGDEPTRQRIRNIIRKMNDTEKSKITSVTLDNCWKKFDKEILLNDLNEFKEQTDVGLELVSTFRTHEIAITLNHTVLDDTTTSSNLMFPDVDETIMFRTIVSNSIYLKSPSRETQNNDNLEMDNEQRPNSELWSVRPNILEMDPFDKKFKSFFTIRSLCDEIVQDFEVTSNFKYLFTITPSSVKLSPNESINININFNQLSFLPKEQINIMVFMENEKIIIPVKIKKDNFPPNLR